MVTRRFTGGRGLVHELDLLTLDLRGSFRDGALALEWLTGNIVEEVLIQDF